MYVRRRPQVERLAAGLAHVPSLRVVAINADTPAGRLFAREVLGMAYYPAIAAMPAHSRTYYKHASAKRDAQVGRGCFPAGAGQLVAVAQGAGLGDECQARRRGGGGGTRAMWGNKRAGVYDQGPACRPLLGRAHLGPGGEVSACVVCLCLCLCGLVPAAQLRGRGAGRTAAGAPG